MIDIDDKIKIYFPLELEPRKQQIDAINFIRKSINNGKKYILLNMPTGSGKSYLIMMFANWYRNFINSDAKFDILTNSKILQYQYIKDFPFIYDLKGMANYYCEHHDTDCSEGKELNKILKRQCDNCPYDIAKIKWINGDMSLTNFALFISMLLYTENITNKKNNVLIIDEAHDFESVFCDFISMKISKNTLKKCGFNYTLSNTYINKFKNIKTSDNFIEFIQNDFIEAVDNQYESLIKKLKTKDKSTRDIRRKQIVYCTKLLEKLENLIKSYSSNKDNWTLDITYDKDKNTELNLQPIWGHPYLKKIVWDNYDHVIFMSGTILDKNMYSYINGIDPSLASYKEMSSAFDIKNRPLYYIKTGKMTYNERKNTFKNQVPIIEKIINKYKDDKGIIHTTNYEISKWVKENIKTKRFIFHDSTNRDKMYDKFIKSKNKIMVSPSMTSGIDLKNDLARFAILLKIPYPNISSNKIKDRQRTNRDWYEWKTIVDIIQTYGRTVRSTDDYSDTFILDSSFSDILRYKYRYLPRYFTDAIKILK